MNWDFHKSTHQSDLSPVAFTLYLSWEMIFMTDLDRGIMKFKGADSWLAIALSTVLILGSIAFLILWALQSAYALS